MAVTLMLVSILAGLVVVIYLFFKHKFNYWASRGVPHEVPRIPWGNLVDLQSGDLAKIANDLYKKYKKDCPISGMYLLTEPFVVVHDLDVIKNVLIKDFNSFHDRGIFYNEKADPLSGHLFLLSGPKWKGLRTKLSPTFTSGRMKFMFPTVVDVGNKFTELLDELVEDQDELEIRELMARFTTDVIGTCAFGIECNSLKDPNAEFRRYGRKIFTEPRDGALIRALKASYRRTAKLLGVKNVRDDVAKFFMGVVRETVDYREKNNICRNDFMDLLIQLKNKGCLDNEKDMFLGKVTFEEVAAQAFVFFIAGFETSSTTLSYCLYELACNQDVQEKLRKEISEVLQKHNNQFKYEAMTEMSYLEQVVCETLRKYPPVPLIFRETTQNYKIPNTSFELEKGLRMFIPAYAIQHDPEIYSNPEKFNPDRFLPEQEQSRHSVSFLAFGDGPRNCIGLRFGKMQTKVGLVALLQHFKFSLGKDTPIPLNAKFQRGILQVKELFLKVESLKMKK